MTNKKTIQAIVDFIVSAEKSIKNAKKLLKDVMDENNLSLDSNIDLSAK
jgi:division protein CdvB (Snf7/Vps24/ESCRT-III family)